MKTGKENFRADEADFVEKEDQNMQGKKMNAEILNDIQENIEELTL